MTHSYKQPFTRRNWLRYGMIVLSGLLLCAGIYGLVLVFSPRLPITQLGATSPIELNTRDDAGDERDRIQIPRMNLEVPYFRGDATSLDKGAWHRYPERGDPRNGGNFILSAHRFSIGFTPAETRNRSPFYSLDVLQVGDEIRVYFEHTWYEYRVSELKSVKPEAVEIEYPSSAPKLTLYSCSLAGSADGRYVIIATPQT